MRVALFLNPDLPVESGGSYAFERELLQAIATYAGDSEHTFYIFGGENYIQPQLKLASHIHFISGGYNSNKESSFFGSAKKIYSYLSNFDEQNILKKIFKPIFTLLTKKESRILKELVNYNIDIIWFLGLHCPTMELPYICTVWDLGHRTQPYFPEVSIRGDWENREKLCATTIQRASFIVTGTQSGKAEIERYYQVPEERIRILPFTAPSFTEAGTLSSSKNVLEKYNIPCDYLFYPAQFWPLKNHASLLKAIQLLKNEFNLAFSVVFTGSDHGNRKYIERLVSELDLTKSVHFLGFVPQEDMAALYHHAFALTYATFLGPDNLPPLEAFSLGCPVIASKVSGAQEQLGDAALLFDPKKPEDLALAIKTLYSNPDLREELIQRGFVRVAQWTSEDYIKGMLSILDEFSAIRYCWSNEELYKTQSHS
jgi:glycosyltransferase involved in cell wall biosynthesis